MNAVILTGVCSGPSELRKLKSGAELLSFEIQVDRSKGGSGPSVRCGYFLRDNEKLELAAGEHVAVAGQLRHRTDSGLFVAVSEVQVCR